MNDLRQKFFFIRKLFVAVTPLKKGKGETFDRG